MHRSVPDPAQPAGLPAARRGNANRSGLLLAGALGTAAFLQWIGGSAVLPLLPLYLSRRGESEALIGLVVAAFFVGGFLAQYAGGRLADRIGHRPVLVLGLVGYALASAAFVIDLGGIGYAVLRALQGAAAGTAMVAALALVARHVPRAVRGRGFAIVYGAELTGMALGPLFGTLVGLDGMSTLFLVAAGGALLACLPVLVFRLPAPEPADPADLADQGDPAEPADPGDPSAASAPDGAGLPWRGRRGRALIGVLVTAGFGGLMSGVYEACWSLLLDARGATPWQLAASWTLFAVPFVVVSPLAGWLADHRDRRVLVVAASTSSVVFCIAYAFIVSPAWLVGLGAFEAVGVAMAMPAAQSLLADVTPAGASGRAQGLFASVNTAAVAVSALCAGGLFGIAPWLPFLLGGVLGGALVLVLPVVWRGVPGRAVTAPGGRDHARVA